MTKIIFIILIIILLTGCRKYEKTEIISPGGRIQIALHSAVGEIFPFAITDFTMKQISEYMLTPSLFKYDSQGHEEPVLAESWEFGEEKNTITYKLKTGMKWSNGLPVTAMDIGFSLNLLQSHKKKYRLRSRFAAIKELEIIDSLTCRFIFNRPVPDPLFRSKIPILPSVWDKYSSEPELIEREYRDNFIGCGPFLLTDIDSDSILFTKNTSNKSQIPNLDSVIIIFNQTSIWDPGARNVHMEVNVPTDNVNRIQADSLFRIMTYPEQGYSFIAWNLNQPLFRDPAMRQILSLGIDRETIVDGVLSGFGSPIYGPTYAAFNKIADLGAINRYNPKRAQQMLDSLGWVEQPAGGRVRSGNPLEFDLKINRESPVREKVALNIKRDLDALGIQVNIEVLEWNKILSAINKKSYDALLVTWIDSDRYDPSELFHSAGINNGLNFTSYSSQVADQFIEQGLNSLEYEKRSAAWQGFQELIARDLPCTFLYNQKIIVAVRSNLRDIQIDHRGYLINIKEWWISSR